MASPFPGMDPYLEDPGFWPDFHHRFLDDWCDAVLDCMYERMIAIEAEPVRIGDLHRIQLAVVLQSLDGDDVHCVELI